MFSLADLRKPIVAAPMAGGPSTPALVAAVAAAGGIGFLAAGYKSVDAVMAQAADTRATGRELFGVNLFVPSADEPDLAAVEAYRERLLPLAESLGVTDLPHPRADDDGWDAKVQALLDDPVPVVSFAFGCPDAAVVSRFHAVGTATVATVTSREEARRATEAGVSMITVQGPGAGGHRATFGAGTTPGTEELPALVAAVRAVTPLPLVAAGGLTASRDVQGALGFADAAQLGTAFLDAVEAGTASAHRAALHDPAFTETVVTRAFSGRSARGLHNAFIDDYEPYVPASYPAVHQVTSPLRLAAAKAGDLQHVHLWAGTGWRDLRSGTASEIIDLVLGDQEASGDQKARA